MHRSSFRLLAITLAVGLVSAGCGGGGGGGAASPGGAAAARGPIKIWYSNNAEEVKWGKAVVAAWNKDHANEQVTAEEIPAGKSSEEVIGAAITAGNTPCLIYNTAPAAVPQFQKQGGLVALDEFSDGASYVSERTGDRSEQYKSPDGKFYQMPWKGNPVMIFYNKKVFTKAGIDAEKPPLKTYDEFLTAARAVVAKGGVQAAIWPSPSSEFYQPWFDFYPLFIAQTGGKQLVENKEPQFTSPEGIEVANFWKTLYDEKLAPKDAATGDVFADGKSAMAIVGPWAIAVYGKKIEWGVAPVPTKDGKDPKDIYTFSDEKSIGMYSSCKSRATAWDFLKFSTSKESDGQLLDLTGQMPMRKDVTQAFPDYFSSHAEYVTFADQANRTVEVPNVPNSVEMWQEFRSAYSKAVIFGDASVEDSFKQAADKIKTLVAGP
jgi:multiple sugar transport system substrate-binding protein